MENIDKEKEQHNLEVTAENRKLLKGRKLLTPEE